MDPLLRRAAPLRLRQVTGLWHAYLMSETLPQTTDYVSTTNDTKDWARRRNAVSQWNRRRKWNLFEQHIKPAADTTVLDVGYSDQEYQQTDNFIEKHYPWPKNITALGIEQPCMFHKRYPNIKVVVYDGSTFPFPDEAFDIVWSNAVVEHVGDRTRQVQFLREVARTGRQAFVTTPNRHFPVEVHTRTPLLHFLPKRIFDRYLGLIGKSWAAGSYMRLLSARELREILAEAGVEHYTIKRNRLLGFTLDFVILIR
jgi:SAM-dependent methyltransferase